ncbi:hypothetical protein M3Y99_01560900 [Aphelenchoides fujianensis]|nr:hypothetical protein M3Y99_01560900 [Aphelenchoides fujianensis]
MPKEKTKRRTLAAPLHRQARERVEAKYAYSQSKKELKKWDPIVQENRAAEQLSFPLRDAPTFYVETAAEKSKAFTPRTNLEKRLAEALGSSKNVLNNDQLYTEAEKELLKAIDLKEVSPPARKKRTRKLQQMRALQSYVAAKQAREARIKSKKYRKVRKREKRKKMVKELEELLTKDPEAAKEKLQELDRDRAYERATLKHRGTGKWSVQLKNYAAKNPGMQKLIAEHLKLGRELKARHGLEDALDGSDESDGEEAAAQPLTKAEMLELAAEQARRELKDEAERDEIKIQKASDSAGLKQKLNSIRKAVKQQNIAQINLADEDVLLAADGGEDGGLPFDADDVVGEFTKEKEELEAAEQKVVDERLFGWGDWTGPGISVEKQQKRKERYVPSFFSSSGRTPGRRGLIIRDAEDRLAALQPQDVPFPFTAVTDFEAVVRQPIGRDWNTNLAHRQLVKRAVVTKAGRIIRPIDKNDEFHRTADEALGEKSDDEFDEILH